LKRGFGMTEGDYEALLLFQGGRCALCWRPEMKVHHTTGRVQMLAVDHDHKTNENRGLLDAECNQLLGKIEGRLGGNLASLEEYLLFLPARMLPDTSS
jgi:hypothetical protein